MRRLCLSSTCALAACASTVSDDGALLFQAQAHGEPLIGANCIVSILVGSRPLVTPAAVSTSAQGGDLRVICNKPGFRTSEYWFRANAMRGTGSSFGVGTGLGSGGGFGVGLGVGMPAMRPAHDTCRLS
ncbi:MAG: hypothetical protein H7315_03240 [Herminiimonas sp.]|nr:hypothetical protein [Herminiimonas sp.]